MKKLFSTINRTEALNAKFSLESNGVPIYIGGEHAGPAPGFVNADYYTVWVCLDSQFEDASKFIEDDSHEISCPVDVAEFYRTTGEEEKDPILSSDRIMLPLIAACIIGFIVWAIIQVSGILQGPVVDRHTSDSLTVFDLFNSMEMDFKYTAYSHKSFNHLRFEVIDKWSVEKNDLETVFVNVDGSLPQLHFQTIGKTEKFSSASTFYDFLLEEDNPGDIRGKSASRCGEFDCIKYEYTDPVSPGVYGYGLIVDVKDGILLFYLKVPSNNPIPYKIIRTNICETLEFK